MTTSTNRMPMAWTKRDVAEMFQQMVEARHVEMGRIVARLRDARGWNQLDLAHASGISVGTISRLENGKHEGRSHTVNAIAKALEVKVQDILPAADPDEGDLSQLDRIENRVIELRELLLDPAGAIALALANQAKRERQPAAERTGRAGSAKPSGAKGATPRKALSRGKRQAG